MSLLRVEGLRKAFGGVQAVAGVSFALAAGEILALIGPNGAGKSTCFNMVGGQLRPDAGRVLLDGADAAGMTPRAICRLGVARTFQVAATFASMTVRENVQLALLAAAGEVAGVWRPARFRRLAAADALLDRVGLSAQAERGAGALAYGDLKRLELAIALANRPRLLLMDEPTAGMAPGERAGLMALARQLATADGIGILFTEHDMDVVFGTADRILVLNRGELIAEGAPAQIRADPIVQEIYLGKKLPTLDRPEAPPARDEAGPAILSVGGLNARYGRAQILHDLAFDVRLGEVVVLLGRNGAGKSTTLKTLIGLVRPVSGRIVLHRQDVAGWSPHRIARAGLGYVPEERRIFADLTVAENLEVGRQQARGALAAWTPARLFALFPNLATMRDRPGGRMSGGEQQMLTIARTLMGNPSLILLDEPSEGLAPVIVAQMADAIRALKAEGVAVLLAEPNLRFAAGVGDRAVVLESGRVAWTGTMPALLEDQQARRAYLGV